MALGKRVKCMEICKEKISVNFDEAHVNIVIVSYIPQLHEPKFTENSGHFRRHVIFGQRKQFHSATKTPEELHFPNGYFHL